MVDKCYFEEYEVNLMKEKKNGVLGFVVVCERGVAIDLVFVNIFLLLIIK